MRRIFWGFLLLFTLAVPTTGTPAGLFTPTVLPPLSGDPEAFAFDISDRGLVAGVSVGSTDTGIVWSRRGRLTMLLPLPGHVQSSAVAINNKHLVLGQSVGEPGPCGLVDILAVIWKVRRTKSAGLETPDAEEGLLPEIVAVRTTLRPLGRDVETEATGINDDGVAVGISVSRPTAKCRTRITAVKWDPDGNPTELPPPRNKNFGWPQAINDHGDVVGISGRRLNSPSGWVATVWSLSGKASVLRPPIRNWTSVAWDINNRRRVAGTMTRESSQLAVVWKLGGDSKVLPPLAGHTRSAAQAINNQGTVIGQSNGTSAVIWRRRVPRALPIPAGHTFAVLTEINESDNVVGVAWNGSGWSAVVWR